MKNAMIVGSTAINLDEVVIAEGETDDKGSLTVHVYTTAGQRTFKGDEAKSAAKQLGL